MEHDFQALTLGEKKILNTHMLTRMLAVLCDTLSA